MTREELVQEIISNARRDRKRLEAVADGLASNFRQPSGDDPSGENESFDTEIAAAFAEEISKVSDSLTKCNQQLVELVKSDRRSPPPEAPVKLARDQVEDVYDEIQPQEQVN